MDRRQSRFRCETGVLSIPPSFRLNKFNHEVVSQFEAPL